MYNGCYENPWHVNWMPKPSMPKMANQNMLEVTLEGDQASSDSLWVPQGSHYKLVVNNYGTSPFRFTLQRQDVVGGSRGLLIQKPIKPPIGNKNHEVYPFYNMEEGYYSIDLLCQGNNCYGDAFLLPNPTMEPCQ